MAKALEIALGGHILNILWGERGQEGEYKLLGFLF